MGKRLIDADALPRHEQLEPMGNGKYENIEVVYGDDIDNAPTIDAVPVVRCKDCKYKDPNALSTQHDSTGCVLIRGVFPLDHYCSYGERKDND